MAIRVGLELLLMLAFDGVKKKHICYCVCSVKIVFFLYSDIIGFFCAWFYAFKKLGWGSVGGIVVSITTFQKIRLRRIYSIH